MSQSFVVMEGLDVVGSPPSVITKEGLTVDLGIVGLAEILKVGLRVGFLEIDSTVGVVSAVGVVWVGSIVGILSKSGGGLDGAWVGLILLSLDDSMLGLSVGRRLPSGKDLSLGWLVGNSVISIGAWLGTTMLGLELKLIF